MGASSTTTLEASAENAVAATWPSVEGVLYQVETSSDLIAFSDLGGVVTGDGTTLVMPDAQSATSNFYRVQELELAPQ